jgi:hypothetical protein
MYKQHSLKNDEKYKHSGATRGHCQQRRHHGYHGSTGERVPWCTYHWKRAHVCTDNHVACFGRLHGSQLREGANECMQGNTHLHSRYRPHTTAHSPSCHGHGELPVGRPRASSLGRDGTVLSVACTNCGAVFGRTSTRVPSPPLWSKPVVPCAVEATLSAKKRKKKDTQTPTRWLAWPAGVLRGQLGFCAASRAGVLRVRG